MPIEKSSLIKLNKVTLLYVNGEDRIKMTAQTRKEDVIDFWLTHRLCRQLVKVMLDGLTHSVRQRTTSSNSPAVEQFLQSDAINQKKKSSPVSRPAGRTELVQTVQVQSNDRQIILRIPLEGETFAVLPLTHIEARQWLNILYKQFELSGWSLDIWPDWFASKKKKELQNRDSVLH